MKNKWRILKILITLILFGFMLHFALKRFNDAKLEKISINLIFPEKSEKVYFIDENKVKDFVKKSNPQNKIGKINLLELENEVNHFPSVDSGNVYLDLSGNLNIDIIQRVPVFRLSKNELNFYVDSHGEEFPVSKNYSHPTMLVVGNVQKNEYKDLINLVNKINEDDFCKKYFLGIKKMGKNYNLITNDGLFNIEIGDLENIDFKINGFKTFVEKYLVYQELEKYSKISLKYNNQIVTTLNPSYKNNKEIIAQEKQNLFNTDNNIKPKETIKKINTSFQKK